MIRFGLCCSFREQPIKFGNAAATATGRLSRDYARDKLAKLCQRNAAALMDALKYCADNQIGCFRVNSQILPLKSHPELGYDLDELPGGAAIRERFAECGSFAREQNLRTSFHPDQFVVLNSPRAEVVEAAIRELEYQAEVAEWIGADVLNVHAGGAYGDKPTALARLARNLGRLSDRVRSRLTLENDDVTYSPADLLEFCHEEGVPLVYDVHHHRCHQDQYSVEEATAHALATWNREPLFHVSSPRDGWGAKGAERHHDYIDPADLPDCWRSLSITVEVEAKAKELAVLELRDALYDSPARRVAYC